MTLNCAIHRLNGVSSPANAAYSAEELTHQLTNSGANCLFTVVPLLPTALEAAGQAGIPRERIYICELADQATGGAKAPKEFKTLGQLMKEGSSLPALEPIRWPKGQGARQAAFLCYSSGTSGLPVGGRLSLGVYPAVTNTSPPERRHDLPPQRHCQHHPNIEI
jgi:acyl-CoA synthetase (AMP-forming)/AMP-acid ligase II